MNRPKVGVGVIILNDNNEILIGKRIGSHSPYYSIPGGHLELGETFEEAAIKEVLEETNLLIKNPQVFCVTNNLRTYKEQKLHYVSINLIADDYSGQLKIMEPEKCENWEWYNIENIPYPQFDASEFAIECFVKKKMYIKNQR